MVRLVKCCAIVTLLCAASVAGGCEREQTIERLHRILDFLLADAAKVDVDCFVGVVIAQAQLNLLVKQPLDPARLQQIQHLQAKCVNLSKTVRRQVQVPNETYAKLLKAVLRPAGWQVDNGFTVGHLDVLPVLPWSTATKELLHVMFGGHPQEAESDSCIAKLIDQGAPDQEHVCEVLPECGEIMFNFDQPCHGYPLTHRLLFLQSYRALNCTLPEDEFYSVVHMLCSRIYQDFRTLESLNQAITRDLYIEQLLLCGLEGYAEFMHRPARTSILEWQDSVGCFATSDAPAAARRRRKRASVPLSHGCDSHMTGLGIAALALNLRYLHQCTCALK